MQDKLIVDIAVDADLAVRDVWNYTPDPPTDEWADYSDFFIMRFDDAMAKNPWAVRQAYMGSRMRISDDCDAQAFTTLSLMFHKGVPLNKLFLGTVWADENQNGYPPPDDKIINHAVGLVKLSDHWRIVGDTFGRSYRIGQQPFSVAHKFRYFGSYINPTDLEPWMG